MSIWQKSGKSHNEKVKDSRDSVWEVLFHNQERRSGVFPVWTQGGSVSNSYFKPNRTIVGVLPMLFRSCGKILTASQNQYSDQSSAIPKPRSHQTSGDHLKSKRRYSCRILTYQCGCWSARAGCARRCAAVLNIQNGYSAGDGGSDDRLSEAKDASQAGRESYWEISIRCIRYNKPAKFFSGDTRAR
jgi:hypothetical protein